MAKAKTNGRRDAREPRPGRSRGWATLAQPSSASAPTLHLDYADFVRQRKDEFAQAIREQRERSLRIADGIADAKVRRAFLKAEADHERAIADFWRRFFRKMRKQPSGARTGGGNASSGVRRSSTQPPSASGPTAPPSGARQLASYSGPVLDRKGRRGVYLAASYLGAKHTSYGCARRLVRYVTDPEHVEWLNGAGLFGSNVGEMRAEMSAAFGLVEDLNRAARANAKIVFHLIVQLPHDVTPAERAEIMRRWCEDQFGHRNLPYVWSVHVPDADGDQRNYHGHVAVSFRPLVRVEPFCWDSGRELKAELDNPEQFRIMREQFARIMTEVAQEAGKNREYTALSHAGRGLKIKPTEHLGVHKTRLVRERNYVAVDARNRAKIKRNEAMLEIERLKRRQTAMERRLARVRRVEARSVDVVSGTERPRYRPTDHLGRVVSSRRVKHVQPSVRQPESVSRKASGPPVGTGMLAVAQRPPARPAGSVVGVATTLAATPRTSKTLRDTAAVARANFDRSSPISTIALRRRVEAATSRRADPHVADRPDFRQPASAVPSLSIRPHRLLASAATSIDVADRPNGTRPIVIVSSLPASRPDVGHTVTATIEGLEGRRVSGRPPQATLLTASDAMLPQPPAAGVDEALLRAAFGNDARRRRQRAKAGAPRAVLAASAKIEWAHATIDGEGALDGIEAFDQIARLTPAPITAITARIRKADFYVHDDGTGKLELDPRAMNALKVSDATLDAEAEQTALADIREEQQRIFDLLVAEAERRPLAFGKTGPRPWPRDLDEAVLGRLDKWSGDEGFRSDLFLAVELPVREAHDAHDQMARVTAARPDTRSVTSDVRLARPIPDGFGGWRDTSAPIFHEDGARPHITAFDAASGRPTDQLLLLLLLAGKHPHRIEVATDGRLMTMRGKPAVLAPLLHSWRHDDRVAALVIETVRASRNAGAPIWPPYIAAAVRAYASRAAGTSGAASGQLVPDLGRGSDR
ncbi:MAG: MobA/MobL family protein [Sphingomonas sp.]